MIEDKIKTAINKSVADGNKIAFRSWGWSGDYYCPLYCVAMIELKRHPKNIKELRKSVRKHLNVNGSFIDDFVKGYDKGYAKHKNINKYIGQKIREFVISKKENNL